MPALQATLSARGVHVPGQRFAGVEVSARVGKSELAPVDVQHPNGVMEIGAELELWVKQRGRGDRGKLAARVLLADPLVILLDALELQLRGLQARLPRPARIELAGRRVDIRGLGQRLRHIRSRGLPWRPDDRRSRRSDPKPKFPGGVSSHSPRRVS